MDNMKSFVSIRKTSDIGIWCNYAPYTDKEQLKLQRESLLPLPIEVRVDNHVNFIYSDYIDRLNSAVEQMLKSIRVVATETVLETEVFYTTKLEDARTTRKKNKRDTRWCTN